MDSNNARIAKNTGLLYFRMIFITLINFYAVRVTLDALGEVDYGVFNVVSSVVASLSLLSGAMTSASQRFLSFHLGRNDYHNYSHTFTLLLLAFIVISLILILIGESMGYFFVEKWLDIPKDRVGSAYWVYQASLVAFLFSFVTIPYTSSIIANERMDAFAVFSLVEGVLKLGIALWLSVYGGDRLELYGSLTALSSIVVFFMSMQYCHAKFKYCKYIWVWNKDIFRQLSAYTGWNLFGSISGILSNQGQAVLLNIYFGPIVNTAKAIADRIQHVIQGFSINLYMAVSPQIIKSYAAEDHQRAHSLVLKTSKLAFLLIFIMSFPLMCTIEGVLDLWLGSGKVTATMIGFSKLMLLYCMVITLEQPVTRIVQASGEIKRYQLSVGVITLMYIPVALLVLLSGGSALTTMIVQIAILIVAQVVRVVVAHRQVGIDYGKYLSVAIYPIIKVMLVSLPVYLVLNIQLENYNWSLVLLRLVVSGLMGAFVALFVGMTGDERKLIADMVRKVARRGKSTS
ncbi:MAG: MATE family efflux transporter [Muribaculum sp.]|nr:MATE family efflux transporter [Muribaculum sp.]